MKKRASRTALKIVSAVGMVITQQRNDLTLTDTDRLPSLGRGAEADTAPPARDNLEKGSRMSPVTARSTIDRTVACEDRGGSCSYISKSSQTKTGPGHDQTRLSEDGLRIKDALGRLYDRKCAGGSLGSRDNTDTQRLAV